MKLISCYISGFGRLEDVTLDFSEGLTQIIAENGWGKTTFCGFLKAMFYGLDYKKSSNAKLYERIRFSPWNQGIYGGNITFTVNEKTYRLERTFGKKDSEDTFSLYDAITEKESTDFKETIGEEIFGVDKDSFEKSIFFGQSLLATNLTPSMNAKMGDISAAKDDMDQFDLAIKRIDDAKKVYTSTSKINPGRIIQLKQRISECQDAAAQVPVLTEALKDRKLLLDDKKRTLRALSLQKEELTGRLAKVTEEKEKLAGLESRREEILARMPEIEKQRFLGNVFGEKELSEELLNEWQQKTDEIKELRLIGDQAIMPQENLLELEELKEIFKDGTPEEERVTGIRQDAERLTEIEGQLTALLQQKEEQERQLGTASEKDPIDPRRGRRLLYLALASVLLIGAVFTFFLNMRTGSGVILPIGLLVGAIIMGVISLTSGLMEKRERTMRQETAQNSLGDLEESIEKCKKTQEELVLGCEALLEEYAVDKSEGLLPAIMELQRKSDTYNMLLTAMQSSAGEKDKAMDLLSEKQLALYTELAPYASAYQLDVFEEHKEADLLELLKKDFVKYGEYKENKARKEELDGQIKSQTVILEQIGKDMTQVEKLQEKQKELDEQSIELNRIIVKEEEAVNIQGAQIEEAEEIARALPSLSEQMEQMKQKVALFEDTTEYLLKAREAFLSAFMQPLRSGMKKYIDLLHEDAGGILNSDDFVLDMDLSVRIRYRGTTKESGFLSKGYQDLTALCARLTLVDVLYKNKKPMLVMDDPFVNFDRDKINTALSVVETISKNSQVIYFTCHESRVIPSVKTVLPTGRI